MTPNNLWRIENPPDSLIRMAKTVAAPLEGVKDAEALPRPARPEGGQLSTSRSEA
jgi:hypothetical protein